MSSPFNFDTFKTSFLATQSAITTFIAANPAYTANILTEARAGAQAGSLLQDGRDIAEPVAVNRIQHDLFAAALVAARADLVTLENALRVAYTRTVNYFWFTRTVAFSYFQDARYVQQRALVDALTAKVRAADGYSDLAEAQQSRLDSQQTAYEATRDAAANNVAAIRTTYETLKDRINGQFVVLKELSKFTIEVLKITRQGQSAAGYVDAGSLISELIGYSDRFSILDDDATQSPSQIAVIP